MREIPFEIKELLEEKASFYNNLQFIDPDPVSIPHLFSRKEDIEVSGFLTAMISWGRRRSIIDNARKLMQLMENEPFEFVTNASGHELEGLNGFCHRTFNGTDAQYFILALRNIYLHHGGLEDAFTSGAHATMKERISAFRHIFFEVPGKDRTKKHVADPHSGSAAKRINMFLRWMVRKDDRGVDFGIWQTLHPRELYCPLDVHTGNVARKLGLMGRNQNDWQAVEELTAHLRVMDPEDPVKYDYALFGLGIFEKF